MHPQLAAIGDRWPALAARDIYRQGLGAFVDGLLAHAVPEIPWSDPPAAAEAATPPVGRRTTAPLVPVISGRGE